MFKATTSRSENLGTVSYTHLPDPQRLLHGSRNRRKPGHLGRRTEGAAGPRASEAGHFRGRPRRRGAGDRTDRVADPRLAAGDVYKRQDLDLVFVFTVDDVDGGSRGASALGQPVVAQNLVENSRQPVLICLLYTSPVLLSCGCSGFRRFAVRLPDDV